MTDMGSARHGRRRAEAVFIGGRFLIAPEGIPEWNRPEGAGGRPLDRAPAERISFPFATGQRCPALFSGLQVGLRSPSPGWRNPGQTAGDAASPADLWIRRTPLRRAFMALAVGGGARSGPDRLHHRVGNFVVGFYVLGTVAVTVVGGSGAGVEAAVTSAVGWGVAEALTGRTEPASPPRSATGSAMHRARDRRLPGARRARGPRRGPGVRNPSRASPASPEADQLRHRGGGAGSLAPSPAAGGLDSPAQERPTPPTWPPRRADSGASWPRWSTAWPASTRVGCSNPRGPLRSSPARPSSTGPQSIVGLGASTRPLLPPVGVHAGPRAASESLVKLLHNARRHAVTTVTRFIPLRRPNRHRGDRRRA